MSADATGSDRFAFASPAAALTAVLARIEPVAEETIAGTEAAGRILAQPVVADRDSPSCDVSAMDGYAVRLRELQNGPVPIAGEAAIGRPPPPLPIGKTLRIFTGAAVPPGAEAVVRREDVDERADRILLRPEARVRSGQNVRRQAENIQRGGQVGEPGCQVDPSLATVLAVFGALHVRVFRALRVGLIVTGDELREVGAEVEPWELRDSNGPALRAFLASRPWAVHARSLRVPDDLPATIDAVKKCLEDCDAVILTGGVSVGDHDHVPAAVEQAGAEVIFHRLPIRPGKPLLAALGAAGQVIFGLPGNPVSVLTTARRFVLPALLRRAGLSQADAGRPVVELVDPDDRTLGLWWYRPVRLVGDGRASLVAIRGSGDIVSMASSDGFVEIPPDRPSSGRWPFYPWR